MSNPLALTLLTSTSTGTSAAATGVDTSLDADGNAGVFPRRAAKLELQVTAASGATPTLDVVVDTSPNNGEPWVEIAAFAQKTAPGFEDIKLAGAKRYLRVSWTIGGTTPSFAFAVAGESHTVFATPDDLILPAASLKDVTGVDALKAKHILTAHGKVMSYVAGAFDDPITAWGGDLIDAEATIASKHLLDEVGWRPTDKFGDQLIARYVFLLGNKVDHPNSTGWLDDVAAGRIRPVGLVDQTPETYEGAGYVVSDARRGH